MEDDDAPLATLGRKAPSFDDDTPLASLGAASHKSKKDVPLGRSLAAAAAKKVAKKRALSTSSSSSSSSDSSREAPRKKKVLLKKGSKGGRSSSKLEKKGTTETVEEDAFDGGGAVKKRERPLKEQVVADLLCRWWYALPDWPPSDPKFYDCALEKAKCRRVSIEEWEWVPDVVKGFKKVYELSQFRGIFRDAQGTMIDLRPKETCPCYTVMMKKDLPELYDLLVLAFENQLKDLQKSDYNEEKLVADLQAVLAKRREESYAAKQLSSHKKK